MRRGEPFRKTSSGSGTRSRCAPMYTSGASNGRAARSVLVRAISNFVSNPSSTRSTTNRATTAPRQRSCWRRSIRLTLSNCASLRSSGRLKSGARRGCSGCSTWPATTPTPRSAWLRFSGSVRWPANAPPSISLRSPKMIRTPKFARAPTHAPSSCLNNSSSAVDKRRV